MGNVILYIAASLDGFIARSGGDIDWLVKYQGGKEDYGYHDFYANVGASIMGSKTYEKSLTLDGGIDDKMPTYVVTHRRLSTRGHSHVSLHSGSLSDLLKLIRGRTDKDIWLVGGGQLAQTFLREGLLDEIILSTVPVILGEGLSLFGVTEKEIDLSLREARSFRSGIVQTRYEVSPSRRRRSEVRQ